MSTYLIGQVLHTLTCLFSLKRHSQLRQGAATCRRDMSAICGRRDSLTLGDVDGYIYIFYHLFLHAHALPVLTHNRVIILL